RSDHRWPKSCRSMTRPEPRSWLQSVRIPFSTPSGQNRSDSIRSDSEMKARHCSLPAFITQQGRLRKIHRVKEKEDNREKGKRGKRETSSRRRKIFHISFFIVIFHWF